MSARAEDAARALSREQPTTADAAVPAPANNGSADAEGVEIPAPEPSGNKNLLPARSSTLTPSDGASASTARPSVPTISLQRATTSACCEADAEKEKKRPLPWLRAARRFCESDSTATTDEFLPWLRRGGN